MKPTRETQRGWLLLALGGLALEVATSGCSYLIAKSGVSDVGEIYKLETRAEVRAAFGEPAEMRTCPNGRTVEHRSFHQPVEWVCQGSVGCGEAYLRSLGLFDVFVVPVQLYRMEQAKLRYVFVYDEDDRVVGRHAATGGPSVPYGGEVLPLSSSLLAQLEEGGCPFWAPCLGAFGAEVHQRAACVGYTLTPEEEQTLHLVQTLAAEVDAGRFAQDETLTQLQWCLRGTPWSCRRP
jgi:hypothetical protein